MKYVAKDIITDFKTCQYPPNKLKTYAKIKHMKTFWQRWWIVNRLHYFNNKKGGIVWASQEEFLSYIKDTVVSDSISKDGVTRRIRFPYSFFGEIKNDLVLDSVLRNLIDECADPNDDVNFLVKKSDSPFRSHIRLSAKGREVYPVSYLVFNKFFGNAYIKAFILLLMTIFTGYYIQNHVLVKRISINEPTTIHMPTESLQ